jgi:hypothetical protein
LDGDIAQCFPAIETAPTVAAPVVRLDFGVFDYGFVAFVPVDASGYTFEVSVGENVVCVRST